MPDDQQPPPAQNPGQWKPGQSGNPKGRAPRAVEREYLNKTIENCTVEDWGEIITRAVRDAKNGDGSARQFLARYILGEPEMVHRYMLEQKKEITVRVEFIGRDLPPPPAGAIVDGEVKALPGVAVIDPVLARELAGGWEDEEEDAPAMGAGAV